MNDVTLKELKIVVERAVRPVRASIARKRKMREELLGHLVSTFAAEVGKLGDEQATLEQAKQRFGDPQELTNQFQEDVPWSDRLLFLLEKNCFEPRQTVLQLLRRYVAVTFTGYAIMILLVLMPVSLMRGWQNEIVPIVEFLFVLAAVMAACWFIFVLLIERIALALSKDNSWRTVRRMALYSLISASVLPPATFLLHWGLGLDLAMTWPVLRGVCCMGLLFPPLVLVFARRLAEEQRYIDEWACLEIDK